MKPSYFGLFILTFIGIFLPVTRALKIPSSYVADFHPFLINPEPDTQTVISSIDFLRLYVSENHSAYRVDAFENNSSKATLSLVVFFRDNGTVIRAMFDQNKTCNVSISNSTPVSMKWLNPENWLLGWILNASEIPCVSDNKTLCFNKLSSATDFYSGEFIENEGLIIPITVNISSSIILSPQSTPGNTIPALWQSIGYNISVFNNTEPSEDSFILPNSCPLYEEIAEGDDWKGMLSCLEQSMPSPIELADLGLDIAECVSSGNPRSFNCFKAGLMFIVDSSITILKTYRCHKRHEENSPCYGGDYGCGCKGNGITSNGVPFGPIYPGNCFCTCSGGFAIISCAGGCGDCADCTS